MFGSDMDKKASKNLQSKVNVGVITKKFPSIETFVKQPSLGTALCVFLLVKAVTSCSTHKIDQQETDG